MTLRTAVRADVTLRTAGPDDQAFLAAVYSSTRAAEMAAVPWPEQQRREFLAMQYRVQDAFYHSNFPDASFDVVMLGTQPVGRLYIHRGAEEHRVIDIALLPQFRRQGIGGRLLAGVLAEAAKAARPVRLHVEADNHPAALLYRRLGFTEVAGDDEPGPVVYRELEWWPPAGRMGHA